MKYGTKSIAFSAALLTLGLTTTGQAGTQSPSQTQANIGHQALATCQQLSANIKEDAILAEMNGQWTLIIYASKIKAIVQKLGDSCTSPKKNNEAPVHNATIQAIVSKAVPTLKALVIQLLDLSPEHAATFWLTHSNDIVTSLETGLRERLTQTQANYVLNLLNQEHFEPFINILGTVLKQHLKVAPDQDKAMVAELREYIAQSTQQKHLAFAQDPLVHQAACAA